MSDFSFIPVSPLLGGKLSNFFKAISSGRIESRYYHKVLLTGLVALIATPFHWWEQLVQTKKKELSAPPVFILGHWRSGTTYLHNLLCQAPDAGYISTYQTVFPNNMHSKLIFKTFLSINIPEKRPTDNVKLGSDLPQEDEFAMENSLTPSFYNFFYFPEDYKTLFDRTVLFKNLSENEIKKWEQTYKKLLIKGEANTSASYMVVKNPVNTARIPKLLEMFPEARFIHIYRNPVMVYLSTKRFFEALFPTLYFHHISPEDIKELVFDLFTKLMREYFETKALIPASNLYEVGFETFEKEPLEQVHQMFNQLNIGNWEASKPYYEAYIDDQKSYEKSTHKISRSELDRVVSDWQFAFDELGYEIPDNLEIIEG